MVELKTSWNSACKSTPRFKNLSCSFSSPRWASLKEGVCWLGYYDWLTKSCSFHTLFTVILRVFEIRHGDTCLAYLLMSIAYRESWEHTCGISQHLWVAVILCYFCVALAMPLNLKRLGASVSFPWDLRNSPPWRPSFSSHCKLPVPPWGPVPLHSRSDGHLIPSGFLLWARENLRTVRTVKKVEVSQGTWL